MPVVPPAERDFQSDLSHACFFSFSFSKGAPLFFLSFSLLDDGMEGGMKGEDIWKKRKEITLCCARSVFLFFYGGQKPEPKQESDRGGI